MRRAIRSSTKGAKRQKSELHERPREKEEMAKREESSREGVALGPKVLSKRRFAEGESRMVEGKRTWFSSLRPARRPPCTSA